MVMCSPEGYDLPPPQVDQRFGDGSTLQGTAQPFTRRAVVAGGRCSDAGWWVRTLNSKTSGFSCLPLPARASLAHTTSRGVRHSSFQLLTALHHRFPSVVLRWEISV